MKKIIIFILCIMASYNLEAGNYAYVWGKYPTPYIGVEQTYVPKRVDDANDWKEVFCFNKAVAAIKNDGSLWLWGLNTDNRLGLDVNKTIIPVPKKLGNTNDWKTISMSNNHTIAIKTDGSLWGWGKNLDGEVGIGKYSYAEFTPTRIGTDNDWDKTFCFKGVSLGIKRDSTLWAWGANTKSETANGMTYSVSSPSPVMFSSEKVIEVFVIGSTFYVLCSEQKVFSYILSSDGIISIKRIDTLSNISDFEADEKKISYYDIKAEKYIFIVKNAEIKIASSNSSGAYQYKVPFISNGESHFYLHNTGNLSVMGKNQYGQLGIGNFEEVKNWQWIQNSEWIDISVGYDFAFGIKKDSSLWSWGANFNNVLGHPYPKDYSKPMPLSDKPEWVRLASASNRSCGLKSDGTLWSWGLYVGDSETVLATIPTKAVSDKKWIDFDINNTFTVAIKDDGTIWGWGMKDRREAIISSNTLTPVLLDSGNWKSVRCSEHYVLAIKNDNSLWLLGKQLEGKTKVSSSAFFEFTQLGTDNDWDKIFADTYGARLFKKNGDMWTVGNTSSGDEINTNLHFLKANQKHTDFSLFDDDFLSIQEDGTLWYNKLNDSIYVETQVGYYNDWLKVSFNSEIIAIKKDGTLWSFGNYYKIDSMQYIPQRIGDSNNWVDVLRTRDFIIGLQTELTSVQNTEKQNNPIKVFPNIIIRGGTALFEFYQNDYNDTSIEIYDYLGNKVLVVLNEQLYQGVYQIPFDTSKLSAGLYMIAYKSNGIANTAKLIVQ